MTDFLVFRLQGALAAWGDTAVGETRSTRNEPGLSALVGLLGAALGVSRADEEMHRALRDGYDWAVGTIESGVLLRDYHTAQVPGRSALTERPHRTRRDELLMPRVALNTILSSRDYRQGGDWLVAAQANSEAPLELSALAGALRRPRFTLYLGRKSCPPSSPLAPEVIGAESAVTAFQRYLTAAPRAQPGGDPPQLRRITWSEGMVSGMQPDLSVPRKDRLIRRRGWQFGDRTEHVALLAERG